MVETPLDRVEGTWIASPWLVPDHVLHDGRLAHLGQAEPVHRDPRPRPTKFTAKAQAMVDKYTVRTETDDKIPVVAPPAGATST